MSAPPRVRLLDVDADIGRYLVADERGAAEALTVPCVELARGPVEMPAILERNGCFGAIVLEGMLACHLRVGEQAGLRILGPGDVVSVGSVPVSMLLVDWGCRAVLPTRLAMLGKDVLVGAHRWPRLIAGLHARTAEQIERVAVQLAICQLPRVEDRLLALLWLLAESWGRVTSSGTVLPIALTHETLGALVGARRPTVTLALGELAKRGAVLRQDQHWLLIERPPRPTRAGPVPHAPALADNGAAVWGVRDTVDGLRTEQSAARTADMTPGLKRPREIRLRSVELRVEPRFSRPPAPS